MEQIKETPASNRRSPMRRWLGIEISAYALVCLSLVTVAWANNRVSGLAESVAVAMGVGVLAVALRGIYRRRQRRQPLDL